MSDTILALEDQVTCWICFEVYNDPITLSCSHTLCRGCVNKMLVSLGACPFCRRSIDPPIPPVNQDIERMCQDYFETKKEMKDAAEFWEQQEQSMLLNIPFEIQVEILLKLPPKEAGRVAKVCKQLKLVTNDSWLWREFCKEKFPFCSVTKYDRNWKHCFIGQSKIQSGWTAGKAGDFKTIAYRGHTEHVTCFKNYKGITVSGSADKSLKVWRGSETSAIKTLEGHDSAVSCLEFNEQRIVSGSLQTVKIWDTGKGDHLHTIALNAAASCLAFNESTLIVGQEAPSLSIHDIRTSAIIKSLAPAISNVGQVATQGDLLYVIGKAGVRVYDLRKPAFAIKDWDLPTDNKFVLLGTQKLVTISNGSIVELDASSGSNDRWDGQLNVPVPAFGLQPNAAISDIQTDGDTLAVLSRDEVSLWDSKTKKKMRVLKKDQLPFNCMRLGPNKVVVGSQDNTIKVWETNSGKKLYNLIGGTLQRRANNPEHPTKPGISGIEVGDGEIVASIASLLRVYDFDTFHPAPEEN